MLIIDPRNQRPETPEVERTPPRPKTQAEILNEINNSQFQNKTRADSIRVDNVDFPEISLTLTQIDEIIIKHIREKIKPRVIYQDRYVNVPVFYATPEKWKSIKKQGFYRDENGKLQLPAIVLKRSMIDEDTELNLDKLDANEPNLYYTIARRYSRSNVYDNFALLTGQRPVYEYYNVLFPTYITVNYEFIIWTEFIHQMNYLIETFMFHNKSYFGEKEYYKFRGTFTAFSLMTDLPMDADRMIRSSSMLMIKGYILSNALSRQLAQESALGQRLFSVKKVIFNERIL